ncbi:molybdopterin cofactor-binding domain-containing protein [Bradyrhizobium sp. LHD-71]|uniref:xanthine dehydrogenase family protein molybdopterin-binding subunit n=1 Tax=Bradyrhizobium sp. LHD-71 TaxID=3072141 RepID=UPI00280E6690|nr:molybdopterin cofactor-binding domain-containing protein [Bradyrhizobium sp. LHD-71]MDQ8727680.1 molybdopterin-dependent oxidoreductase [Bradyrhizobium sp. LHD-71]
MKRRTFLLGTAAVAGGLALGYRVWSAGFDAQAAALAGTGTGAGALLAGWVKIGADDVVTVYVPHADMGQGTHTALAMMLADELDADWARVRTERAPADKAFANRFLAQGWVLQGWQLPSFLTSTVGAGFAEAARFINLQITGGSTAVRFTGQGLRVVGAAARSMLAEAAARRWQVDAKTLSVASSVVSHPPSGRSARFGELAADAATLTAPSDPQLKARRDHKLIGRSLPRLDVPAKVTGEMQYGIDLSLPDMLHAAVRSAPVHGGKLVAIDVAPALKFDGVERVVKLESSVAVVAKSFWQARRALDALHPVFDDGGNGGASTRTHFDQQARMLADGKASSVHRSGDAEAMLKAAPADRIVEATYRVPFLHHAAMEPINATAQFKKGELIVWAGEQDALGSKAALAASLGLAADKVTLHALPIGGAFGRRIAQTSQHLALVAEIAKVVSPRPVKMIWTREEDFAQGAYRPAVSTYIRAALGADGRPTAWSQVYVDLAGPGRREGYQIPYDIPAQSLNVVAGKTHVRTGTWRSVAHSQHAFYTECFMDELAAAAGRDPFEYRRDLLPTGSRLRKVLELAAEKAEWAKPLAPGAARGLALVESFGTIVAHVIEASLGADGSPQVHRVTAAVDCGDVCHPDNATAQVEGAIIMGLSAAIGEQITIEQGEVVQKNFPDYPLLTFANAPPRIDVHFLASDGPWGGLGEPGLPPVAPALANAMFAISGKRQRILPLTAAA